MRESMSVVFCEPFTFSILVEVLMVNLFSIFLLDSPAICLYWYSLASLNEVVLANFFMFSILLFLQPSIVV